MFVQKGKNNIGKLKIVIAWVVFGVLLISLVVLFIVWWASSKFSLLSLSTNTQDYKLPTNMWDYRLPTNMQDYSEKRWPCNRLCQCFSLDEIKATTNNFDNTSVVGERGFDHVYKGYIDDISIPVAIKHLKPGSKQGFEEFLAEIGMLS